jgi:hypothetical protein
MHGNSSVVFRLGAAGNSRLRIASMLTGVFPVRPRKKSAVDARNTVGYVLILRTIKGE